MAAQRKSADESLTSAVRDGAALRCHCGSLIARLVPTGVEIKCRRCKRRVILPLGTDTVSDGDGAAS